MARWGQIINGLSPHTAAAAAAACSMSCLVVQNIGPWHGQCRAQGRARMPGCASKLSGSLDGQGDAPSREVLPGACQCAPVRPVKANDHVKHDVQHEGLHSGMTCMQHGKKVACVEPLASQHTSHHSSLPDQTSSVADKSRRAPGGGADGRAPARCKQGVDTGSASACFTHVRAD